MRGHIRKRGRSWAIVVDRGRDGRGRRRQRWHTVQGTKRDAQRELARLPHELNTGAYLEPTRITMCEYLERWLADYAKTNVNPKTFERYREIVRLHLIPALGGCPLVKLQPLHIQAYYSQAIQSGRRDGKHGLAAQTVLHHHRVLREALMHAQRWQLIVRNPADLVEPPRPPRKEAKVLDVHQAGDLLAALDGHRLYNPVLLALTTGMRRGEIRALRWPDVDFEAGTLTVRKSLQQTNEGVAFKTPKSGKGRTVALPPMAVEVLGAHRVAQAEQRLALGGAYANNDLVFARPDGHPWEPDSFTSSFSAFVRRARLPHITFHGLRHTHATLLLTKGIHPKVVSERLGHSKVGFTLDIYAHVLPGMQKEAARRIEAALKAAISRSR